MAYGDIGSKKAGIEYDTTDGWYPSVLLVGPGVIAIWNYNSANGIVRTYPIDGAGNIGALIDSWTFQAGLYGSSDWDYAAVRVSGNVYAVAYRGPGNILFVKTMSIAPDGTITKVAIETKSWAGFPVSTTIGSFIKKTGTQTYAVTWLAAGNAGMVATIHINDDGTNISSPDSWAYSAADGNFSVLRYHTADIFVLIHGNTSVLKTFSIADNGVITKAFIDTQVIDAGGASRGNHEKVSGDLWVVYYQDSGNDGKMATFTVDSSGNISAIIASLLYRAGDMLKPKPIKMGTAAGLTYFVVNGTFNNAGYLYSQSISSDGLTLTQIDNITLEPNFVGQFYKMAYVGTDIYAVVYSHSVDTDGFLDTFDANTPPTARPMGQNLARDLLVASGI